MGNVDRDRPRPNRFAVLNKGTSQWEFVDAVVLGHREHQFLQLLSKGHETTTHPEPPAEPQP